MTRQLLEHTARDAVYWTSCTQQVPAEQKQQRRYLSDRYLLVIDGTVSRCPFLIRIQECEGRASKGCAQRQLNDTTRGVAG
jgi:hypothetical protein